MKPAVAHLLVGFIGVCVCQLRGSADNSAKTGVSIYDKRMVADFGLSDVHSRYASGMIDRMDIWNSLKTHFPKGAGRDGIERLVYSKKWPQDVLVLKDANSLSVYYYEVEDRKGPIVTRYSVRFRFLPESALDRVDYDVGTYCGGVPSEMPKSILREPNQSSKPTLAGGPERLI